MTNPHEWHIASDGEGFFIEDEFGEEILPYWMLPMLHAGWRCKSNDAAQSVLRMCVAEAIDNYEPPDPPGFEGGFAPNH